MLLNSSWTKYGCGRITYCSCFMICFLFKLSNNVMIMCEWHQLVHLGIVIDQQTDCISRCSLHISQRSNFFKGGRGPKLAKFLKSALLSFLCPQGTRRVFFFPIVYVPGELGVSRKPLGSDFNVQRTT